MIIFEHDYTEFGKICMVNWKVAFVVVFIVVLVMVIGMWFGYRYVSEQDDISPEGWRERSDPTDLYLDKLFVLLPVLVNLSQQ